MREIKFRVWDGEKMRYECLCAGFEFADAIAVRTKPFKNGEIWELMQFTGLHDKNGKEIWEGDLVLVLNYLNGKIWEGHTHIDEVIFTRGGFNLKNPWCHESLSSNTVEVIGNRWERNEKGM